MADKTPEQQIKEAIWTYTGWTVLLLAVFLSGLAAGYLFWGDAPSLRAQVTDLTQKVSGVRAERENLQTQMTMLQQNVGRTQRAADECQSQLQQLKAGSGAAPATASP